MGIILCSQSIHRNDSVRTDKIDQSGQNLAGFNSGLSHNSRRNGGSFSQSIKTSLFCKFSFKMASSKNPVYDRRSQCIWSDLIVAKSGDQYTSMGGQQLPNTVGCRVNFVLRVQETVPERRGLDGDISAARFLQLLCNCGSGDFNTGNFN